MASERLLIRSRPALCDGRMIVALSGWMDGGDVSTGTVEWLVRTLEAAKVAEIAPEGFYLYNFPGSMEIAALFRPSTKIEDGLIISYEPPASEFYCDPTSNLLLFNGKEPHLNWSAYADGLFSFAQDAGVKTIYFVGSVAGTVPHTREPRLTSSVSDECVKRALEPLGVRFTDYEGPASFATFLMTQAGQHGLMMASLVAEVPAYIQGTNPKSIEAVVRKLAAMLGLRISLDRLRAITDAWEKRLHELLEREEELARHIEKLEADYDNEVFDSELGDLKEWLQQRGIRVD